MPGKNLSQYQGTSPSPSINRVVTESRNNQQAVSPQSATKPGTAYNKTPVKNVGKK